MKLVLMGTGPFAVPSFAAIAEDDQFEIAMVVTKPTQNNDGKKRSAVAVNPVLDWATSKGLTVFQPRSANDEATVRELQGLNADLLVVCDYGQILSRDALAVTALGGINLHGSLLPRHRGAAPVQWAVLRGDAKTGISVIYLTPKLDGGPIIQCESVDIGAHEDAESLEKRLSELGAPHTLNALRRLAACQTIDEAAALGPAQENSQVTKAPRLAKAFGRLDPRYSATLIDRQIRGLQPWPGVFGNLTIGETLPQRVIVKQAEVADNHFLPESNVGEIVVEDNRLFLQCNENSCLELLMLQISGKRPMTADEFIRGYASRGCLQLELPTDDNPLLIELIQK
jgi:methionyl-tRNA formyltransferase